MAGLVDARTGVLLTTPNLVWRNLPLEAQLHTAFSLPVSVENDATAAAWAERSLGASRDYEDSLFVGVGTGIGGGVVMGGRVVRGAHGLAGEIGHVIVEPDGPVCGCGNRGCWEQVASGLAIARAGARTVAEDPGGAIGSLVGGDPRRVTGEVVSQAARDGDVAATALLAQVGRRLGEGVAGLVNVLDPEIVVIGGGASEAGELLLAPLRAAFVDSLEGADVRPGGADRGGGTRERRRGHRRRPARAREGRRMRLGLSLPMFTDDAERPLAAAARAARAGYEGVFAPDHPLPAGGARPARARTLRDPRRGGGSPSRVARRDARVASLPPTRGDPRETGGGVGCDERGPRDPRSRGGRLGVEAGARGVRHPVRPRRTTGGAPGGDGRSDACPVRRSVVGGRRPRPRDRGALAPARASGALGRGALGPGHRGGGPIRRRLERLGDGGRAIRRGGARAPPRGRGPDRVADLGRDSPRRQGCRRPRTAPRRAPRQGPVDGCLAGDGPAFRAFADRLRDMDCSWIVVLPVGGADRIEVVAEALER